MSILDPRYQGNDSLEPADQWQQTFLFIYNHKLHLIVHLIWLK